MTSDEIRRIADGVWEATAIEGWQAIAELLKDETKKLTSTSPQIRSLEYLAAIIPTICRETAKLSYRATVRLLEELLVAGDAGR